MDFSKTKYGMPTLAAGCVAVCVLLGLGICAVAFGAPVEAASSGSIESTAVSEAKEDSDYDAKANAIDTSKYSDTILPESEDAGEDYIENTLFIGDSNSYRYMCYGFTSLDNDIAVVGMGAGQILSLGCVKFKTYSDYITIPEAIKIMQPQRVVFGYGTNNLTGDMKTYISTYEKAIQKCYKEYPYFDVMVNAIPPVDKYRDYPNVSMQNIDKFNAALVEMCERNGWKFINSSEALKDKDTGFAQTKFTLGDGLHLSKEGCTALFNYIRTHSMITDDTRPKPLSKIPARAETPPDLIVKDPLKVAGEKASTTKVNVTFNCTDGGTLTGETEQSVAAGSYCSGVTAVPSEGYYFAGWSCAYGDTTNDTTITYLVPSDAADYGGIVVTAKFAKKEAESTATPTPTPTLAPTPSPTPGNSVVATPSTAPSTEPPAVSTPAPATEPPAVSTPAPETEQPTTPDPAPATGATTTTTEDAGAT
ncbi:MAG: hypothetical protein LKJ90_01340 [Faecalibacterium sp.]|nr:hypothetical protein [Faecalibacterium sp.]